MSVQQFIGQAENAAAQASLEHIDMGVVYMIKPGDTLSEIVNEHYGVKLGSDEYNFAINTAIVFNDNIEEENHIRAGEAIRLMPLANLKSDGYCPAPPMIFTTISSLQHDLSWSQCAIIIQLMFGIWLQEILACSKIFIKYWPLSRSITSC